MNLNEEKEAMNTAEAASQIDENHPDDVQNHADSDASGVAEMSAEDAAVEGSEAEIVERKTKKKRSYIQIPVLISLGIVVLALIGYFVGDYIYQNYYYHIPQGIVWAETKDDITYYYEFSDDNLFTRTYGSHEEQVPYEELYEGGEEFIRLYYPEGTVDLTYTITGARIRKDQQIVLSDMDGNAVITCDEVESRPAPLELPTEVVTDQGLLGKWEYTNLYGYTYYLTFNADGSMRLELVGTYYGTSYLQAINSTYNAEDGVVNWTSALLDDDETTGKAVIVYETSHDEYVLDGDNLEFLKMPFVRVSDDATPDEA